MNEEDKKLLTEYLDECWHGKFIRNYGHDCEVDTMCEHCWKAPHELKYPKNRTFTTWQDLGGLISKLKEKSELIDFIKWRDTIMIPLEWEGLSAEQRIKEIFNYITCMA